MKRTYTQILLLAAVLSITLLSSSCKRFRRIHGSGNAATEKRTVVDFTRIDISGGFKVNIVQDSSSVVTVSADDNLLKYIKTSVEGGKLRLYTNRNLDSQTEMTVTIGVKKLEEIHSSGGVEIVSKGKINAGNFNFDLSGSTHIDMDLSAADVHTSGSGSTELVLKGQAASHDLDMSGSSDIDALDFVVGKYNIETSGASKCKINVLKSLSIHSSGSSEVVYRGNPSNVSNDKSGSSSLTKID
ncbi:hypothetical protein A0256_12180 [Mucilaginibacter sp. PAMC 26640]|nr:hypothetical protein A0256_12180 [Mucilaginibacter sp. PAMC 26640]